MACPREAHRAALDAVAAIDVGLGEARQAVALFLSSSHADSGLCNLARRSVEDYGDQFGLRVEFAFEGEHARASHATTHAEILLTLPRGVTSVARHAEATVGGGGGGGDCTSSDKGTTGFTLRAHSRRQRSLALERVRAGADAFGLASMRERAALIGGRLRIASRAGAGTRAGVVLDGTVRAAGGSSRGGIYLMTTPGSPLRVMVVDDHPLVRSAVARAMLLLSVCRLDGHGHDSGRRNIVSGGGARARAADRAGRPPPRHRAAGHVRRRLVRGLAPRLPATKIVMLTVSSADRDVADAMRYGASGYLTRTWRLRRLPEPCGRRRPAS